MKRSSMSVMSKLKSVFGRTNEPEIVSYQCQACFHNFEAPAVENMRCEACRSEHIEIVEEAGGSDTTVEGETVMSEE